MLGAFGFILAAAFFGRLIWVGIDYGVIDENNPRLISYICLVAVAGILTAGMLGSQVRANSLDR